MQQISTSLRSEVVKLVSGITGKYCVKLSPNILSTGPNLQIAPNYTFPITDRRISWWFILYKFITILNNTKLKIENSVNILLRQYNWKYNTKWTCDI